MEKVKYMAIGAVSAVAITIGGYFVVPETNASTPQYNVEAKPEAFSRRKSERENARIIQQFLNKKASQPLPI